jgi:anti-sigma factor RsiW
MNAQRPDDAQLSAWLDGELNVEASAHIDAWLRDHPEDAAQVRLWAADRDALRARFDPTLDEPVPERLLAVVREGDRRSWVGGWARAAMAAGLVAGGALLGAGVAWQTAPPGFAQFGRPNWTHRAAVAHVVYAPEVRHPVEVFTAEGSATEQRAQEEHLSRWLTKRLDMPVRTFDLRAQGFQLVGGRLLPDAAGPSAQLMYQNGEGQRVTVYLRKPEPGMSTSFRFQRDGELGMFYWVEDGFGCAMVGKLPRERLLALAEAVYKQSEASIPPAPAKPPV